MTEEEKYTLKDSPYHLALFKCGERYMQMMTTKPQEVFYTSPLFQFTRE